MAHGLDQQRQQRRHPCASHRSDSARYDLTWPTASICEARGSSSTTTCIFDAGNNRIFWQGTIGPDLGATDEATAQNEVVITFRVNVALGRTRVFNQASALTDTNGDGSFTDETGAISVSTSNLADWSAPVSDVPLVSAAGLAAAIGLLLAVGSLGLRRRAQRP